MDQAIPDWDAAASILPSPSIKRATQLTFSTAYLLVTHGSRDPRPHAVMARLAQLVCDRILHVVPPRLELALAAPQRYEGSRSFNPGRTDAPLVGTAVLELDPLPLHQQIHKFAVQALQANCTRLKIVPLFLLPGVHVMEDIPAEVAIAQTSLGADLTLEMCPYLGQHPRLKTLLSEVDSTPQATKILISHGSRRPGGNHPVEAIAAALEAIPAYWSVPPSLKARIVERVSQGDREIVILPYFLFPGGLTDAIAQQVTDLAHQYPHIQLSLAEPIGVSDTLADIVIDLIQ